MSREHASQGDCVAAFMGSAFTFSFFGGVGYFLGGGHAVPGIVTGLLANGVLASGPFFDYRDPGFKKGEGVYYLAGTLSGVLCAAAIGVSHYLDSAPASTPVLPVHYTQQIAPSSPESTDDCNGKPKITYDGSHHARLIIPEGCTLKR